LIVGGNNANIPNMTITRIEWIDRYLAHARQLCPELPSGYEAEQIVKYSHTEVVTTLINEWPDDPEAAAWHHMEWHLEGERMRTHVNDGED
jgi:hypothetical protein